MQWTEVQLIGESLFDRHEEIDPRYIRFTDLHAWVTALEGFDDDPDRSNEKILEAIQAVWISEWE